MMGNKISIAFAALSLFVAGCSEKKLSDSYKVENVGGVPRLVFNGEPVRARMLYVSPTYFLLGSPTGRTAFNYREKWVETFVEIPPLEKPVKNASIQFKPSASNFSCAIAALRAVEADTGKTVYELDCKNGDVRATAMSPKKDAAIKFALDKNIGAALLANAPTAGGVLNFAGLNLDAGKKYRIDIKVKSLGQTFNFDLYTVLDGKFLEPKIRSFVGLQTKIAAEAGVDIITFPVQAADFFAEGDKKANYANLKGAMDEIVSANPNAKILVRIRCYPPQWWMEKYKDDIMTSSDGKHNGFAAPASARFRADCVKAVRLVMDYCEGNYGANVIGYHPGGGSSSEWFYPYPWVSDFYGYSASDKAAWKEWVSKKYKTDAALRAAWKDASASLANAAPPTAAERSADAYVFNPSLRRKSQDYNVFMQDAMVETISILAKTIKERVPNKLCAFFYGYSCEFARARKKSPAEAGHYALMKLLQNKNIDLLCSPVDYTYRDLGDGNVNMNATETVTRSGKIWVNEDDIRTYRTPQTQQKSTAIGKELRSLKDTLSVLRRNLAQEAVRNNGNWWMDLSGTGWYDDPKIWELMPAFKNAELDMIKHPSPYAPDIAIIGDEYSLCIAAAGGKGLSTTDIFSKCRYDFSELGAPFGQYLLDDVLFGKPYSPKLYMFSCAYALDAKQRAAMRKKTADTAAIFVWIPAYIDKDGETFSAKAVAEATGFDVKEVESGVGALAVPTAAGRALGITENFGFKENVSPLLSPTVRDGDVVLANYANGQPAAVLRGKHLFCGVADVPKPLYRHMIELSGARVYTRSPAAVYANAAYISVTSVDQDEAAKPVKINVGCSKDVFDALTGEKLGAGPEITLEMKRGDSVFLRLGRGNADFVK